MLIFVSDLHLGDSRDRSSFDDEMFLRELHERISTCPPGEKVNLVLLGDIFELLKSTQWLRASVRPWHRPSKELTELGISVLNDIAHSYPRFFDGLRKLHDRDKVGLVYVPGNHDALLADESGGPIRARLRTLLPVQGKGEEPWLATFADADHGVFAEHGHEFDDFNRPEPKAPRYVAGDVVVIELVARLPVAVRKVLRSISHPLAQDNGALRFLDELDNVLPQDGEGLMSWLQFSLERTPGDHRDAIRKAVLEGLAECISCAQDAAKEYGALTKRTEAMLNAAIIFVESKSLRILGVAARLRPDIADEVSQVTAAAQRIWNTQVRGGQKTFLYIAGHTHFPRHHPIAVGLERTIIYLNSGTWRRVYLRVSQAVGAPVFVTYNEETMLCVYRRVDDNPPRYELRRQVRGL